MGIIICGLNGTGKSTLGKALAEKLHFHFIDIENLYFPKTDPNYIYASPRTREEVKRLLLHEMGTHENFILASVKGDYGEDISSFFQCVILLDVPKDIRMQRVKKRSFQKFGNRMLLGGDLYEQEEKFFCFVESRDENTVEEWVKSLKCPVIRIDGTKSIDANINLIIEHIQNKDLFTKKMRERKMTCKIRKWELSDAKDLAVALSNKKIQDNLRDGLPYPYTEQDGVDYISAMLSADEKETFAFAITVDDKVVGSIGVFRQENIHRQTAELGYYVAEEYWGKGIMTEAVTQICEYVFGKSDIIRIYAEPFAYNAASCRVLEKAGFQYEGTLRSNAVKNGKVIDMKMYSLLKTGI